MDEKSQGMAMKTARTLRAPVMEDAVVPPPRKPGRRKYVLDAQVGFLLRQVNQRHTSIFAGQFDDDLTTTQWAVLAKLVEVGPMSQNSLGRATAMDVATIKGVVDRLMRRDLVELRSNPDDGRQLIVALTKSGRASVGAHLEDAFIVTEKTLAPLSRDEIKAFVKILHKLR